MMDTKEKVTVNIIKPFIIYISRNKKSWKIIDELYYKHYDRCIAIQDDVKEALKLHNIKLDKETIQNTCYINKFVALMILDEMSVSTENTMTIIESAFNKAYKYTISNTTIKLKNFTKRKIDMKESIDNIFSECLAVLMTARVYGKNIDESDESYLSLLNGITRLDDIENGSTRAQFSYEKCDKSRKSFIDSIELIIRGRYFMLGYNIEGLHEFLEAKKCFNRTNGCKLDINKIKNDIYCKMQCTIEYTDNIFNKTNAGVLFNDIELDKLTIKDFINTYLILSGYEKCLPLKKEDINIEELTTFVSLSAIQALYIEAYNESYKFFFENYSENTTIRFKKILDECKEFKKKSLKLQDENERLKNEVEELKRKLNKSDGTIEKYKSNNKELFELRNYIFNNQEEYIDDFNKEIDIEYLKDKKIVCFGGNKAWITNMIKEFDNWTFVSAETINFDASILKDADIVFIKATHIGHAMYYKIMANLDDNTEIKFINNNNVNVIKQEISILE